MNLLVKATAEKAEHENLNNLNVKIVRKVIHNNP